jgi:uncharacterized protein (TIGR03066 family)
MRALRLVGIACVVLCLAACSGKKDEGKDSGKTTPTGAASNADKIVGKWEMTKAPKGEEAIPTTYEFTKDGKLKMTSKVMNADVTVEGTYKVGEGDKMTITMKTPDGKEVSETGTIKTLNDTTLVLLNEKTKEEMEFKRK